MEIQQVRTIREKRMGSDGQVRTYVDYEPVTDAHTLSYGGKEYETLGNGVFRVPEEVGQQLVGGIFRDLSDPTGEFTRAKVRLANQHKIETAPNAREADPEAPIAPPDVAHAAGEGDPLPNAAVPSPVAPAEPQAPAKPKKPRKRTAKKATAAKKVAPPAS